MVVLTPSSSSSSQSILPAAAAPSLYGDESKSASFSQPLLASSSSSAVATAASSAATGAAYSQLLQFELPLRAMIYLPLKTAALQTTPDGRVVCVGLASSFVPFWSVTHLPPPPSSCGAGEEQWVHLTDASGRFLAAGAVQPAARKWGLWSAGPSQQLCVVSGQPSPACMWRLFQQSAFGRLPSVKLRSTAGLTLQACDERVECRAYNELMGPWPTLVLPWTSNLFGRSWEGSLRPYSQPLDASDELSSTSVALESADGSRRETLLAAMPDTSVTLAAANSSAGAAWSLVRTAAAGVVYLRSAAGLHAYLTAAPQQEMGVGVLVAPKCRASTWRVVERGSGGTQALQHCETGRWLQAEPRRFCPPKEWVCCVDEPTRATTFFVRAAVASPSKVIATR